MQCAHSQAGGSKAGKGKATASKSPKPGKSSGDSPADEPAQGGSKKTKGATGSGQKGRPPTFPPAHEIGKGSRVELTWDHVTYEAVVLTMGARDKDGQARVHWASPGLEPDENNGKEWKSLDELRVRPQLALIVPRAPPLGCDRRCATCPLPFVSHDCLLLLTRRIDPRHPPAPPQPLPPAPPKNWLYKLRESDVVAVVVPGGDSWVEAAFQEIVLPDSDAGTFSCSVLLLDGHDAMTLPQASVRPLWHLNKQAASWSLIYRRTGARASSLLVMRREGEGWLLVDQVGISGAEPTFSEDDKPTRVEKLAARAVADASLVPILLTQVDGAWRFGGDGTPNFLPPRPL